MATVAQVAMGGGAIIAAGLLEEVTHAVAARPWAVKQRISLTRVRTEVPEETPMWVNKWVNYAPFLVGLAALAVLYLGRHLPPLSDESVLLYVAWAWYTMPSPTDVLGARDEKWDAGDPQKFRIAWRGVTVETVGLLLLMGANEIATLFAVPTPPSEFEVGLYWQILAALNHAGIALMFGGVAYLLGALWADEVTQNTS